MDTTELVDRVAKQVQLSEGDLLRESLIAFLRERRRKIVLDRLEILSKYRVYSIEDLEQAIENGKVLEHPGWEDLIEAENLEAKLAELDQHIGDI